VAQVYSMVLDGKPLGYRVKLEGSEEWQETGAKPLERQLMLKSKMEGLPGSLISPIVVTHIVPGMVSRQRAYTWFRNIESQNRLRDCVWVHRSLTGSRAEA